MSGAKPAILAVDGGNSKADIALIASDGTLLAAVHGPSISHQQLGIDGGMANLRKLAARAASESGGRDAAAGAGAGTGGSGARATGALATLGVYTLAGADYPEDERLLRRGIEALGLTDEVMIFNDTFGALRAGTSRPWGVVLICGRGINGAAVAPDGRRARFDAVGTYSGDWGGGMGISEEGLAAAVRAADGRGGRTVLRDRVPAHFGLKAPAALTKALYFERIPHARLLELAPIVFEAATDGDAVARSIIDRLADELVAMGSALIRRLRLTRLDPEVVLAGGVFHATDARFYERIGSGIGAVAPAARLVRLTAPPVLGAGLIGLDRLGEPAGGSAESRLRTSLEAWDP